MGRRGLLFGAQSARRATGACARNSNGCAAGLVAQQDASVASLRCGDTVSITSIAAATPHEQRKLMALGVLPGATLRLLQRCPSYVVSVGYTQVTMDHETARLISVSPDASTGS